MINGGAFSRILTPSTTFATTNSNPTEGGSFLNFQDVIPDPDLDQFAMLWFQIGPLVPRGVLCPDFPGGSCTLVLADVTFTLPEAMTAGDLLLNTNLEAVWQQGDRDLMPTVPTDIDTSAVAAGVTFTVVEGYEFSITGNNDTDTTDPEDVDVAEGDTATFDVTLSPAMPEVTESINVPWSVTAGTADAADLGGTSGGTLTFTAGVTTQTISIPIPADMLAEGEEAFTLALGTPNPAITGGVNITADTTVVTATIEASDAATVAFDSTTGVAVVSQTGQYQISLENMVELPSGTTLLVPYRVGGTAGSSEYTATPSGPISISGTGPGVITIDVPIPTFPATIGDVEGDTIVLTLGDPSFSAGGVGLIAPMLGTNNVLTLTIRHGYMVSVADVVVDEADATADLMVRVIPPPQGPFTVNLETSDDSALAGEDYDAVTTTVNFAVNETSQTVSVPITNDMVTEGEESFTVTLSNPLPTMLPLSGNNVPVMADDIASVTISANDPLSVDLEVASVTVIGQSNSYAVSLGENRLPAAGAGISLTVSYNIAGSAVETSDYIDVSDGRVTIAAGSSSADIQINIPSAATGGRQFTITLVDPPVLAGISGAPDPLITTGQGSRTIDIVQGPDVDGNGVLDEDDAEVMFYTYNSAFASALASTARRNGLMGHLTNSFVDTTQGLVDNANLWRDAAVPGFDVDGNGVLDEDDAEVMFYTYNSAFASALGSTARRNGLMGHLTNRFVDTTQELVDNARELLLLVP